MVQGSLRSNEWKSCVASKTLELCFIHAKIHAWVATISHTYAKFYVCKIMLKSVIEEKIMDI